MILLLLIYTYFVVIAYTVKANVTDKVNKPAIKTSFAGNNPHVNETKYDSPIVNSPIISRKYLNKYSYKELFFIMFQKTKNK